MNWLEPLRRKVGDNRAGRPRSRHARPCQEDLESRVVLYTASGNLWLSPQLITVSFVPDGTNLNGKSSNLFSTFNSKFGSASTWENVILEAAQLWAQQTNINFSVVSDNGAAEGSGSYQQGDPNFGDIRIGGYDFGNSSTLAETYMPPPINNYSAAGDIMINTDPGVSFKINGTYDLETVMAHELGHALGLLHSSVSNAVMYAVYNGIKQSLTSDDIAGIQSIYGGARTPDQYEGSLGDGSFSTTYNINSLINSTGLTALVTGADITTTSDQDYYVLTVPSGTNGTMKVTMQSQGLSLLEPQLTIYNSSQTSVGSVNGTKFGDTVTVTVSGVSAGQNYYIKAFTPLTTANGTGAYALSMTFGANAAPTVPIPNTEKANGSPLSSGGGIASRDGSEILVNTYTTGIQQTDPNSPHSVGIDLAGDSVVTWESQGEDGSGWGVYAQRFDPSGNKVGSEFRVNTTTTGDQMNPTVSMNAGGSFVITWQSQAQDGSGWGIYAQRYNASGNKVGGEFQVNTTTAGDQEYPSVAMNAFGGFVITWQSNGQDGNGWGIYAQRYDYSGNKVGGEFQVNTTTAGDQTNASVAMGALGAFVVTWQSYGQDGSGWGIYAQQYDYNGNKVGGEFRVNTTTTGDQEYPSVAINALGNYVITWSSDGQDGSGWGIYVQRYNSKGVMQGGETLVNTTTTGDQEYSTVAMDIMGGFVVTWSSLGEDGNGWGVYARQFSPSGTPVDIEVPVTTTTACDQIYSSVAMSATGQLLIDWSGNGVGDSSGVFMQRFSLSTISDSEASDTFQGAPGHRGHHGVSHAASGHDKGGRSKAGPHEGSHSHGSSVIVRRAHAPSVHQPAKKAVAKIKDKVAHAEGQTPLEWSGVETRFQFQSRHRAPVRH